MPRRHWRYFSEKTPKSGKWICIIGKDKIFITISNDFFEYYDYDEYTAWCYVNVWRNELDTIYESEPCKPDIVVGEPYIVDDL